MDETWEDNREIRIDRGITWEIREDNRENMRS